MSEFDDPRDDERAAGPPDDYLIEEQARFARRHRDEAHGGGPCVCLHDVFSTEAPF